MVALAALSLSLTVGFSWQLGQFIASIFSATGSKAANPISNQGISSHAIWLSLVPVLFFGLGRASLIWLQDLLSVLAGAKAKSQLRQRLLRAIGKLGVPWLAKQNTADIALLASKLMDSLDAYFSKFLPQLVYTGLVTQVLTLIIFLSDFWSGIAIICTVPLIPLFMVFIGWATNSVQQEQLDSQTRMATHFGEAIRGITTLKVFGRLPFQPELIRRTSENYRKKTMKVLRSSFLSGMALEVAASLSVALIAVSIGLRLIDGSLKLETGLFVLLLAPEAYLPLRMVGAQFHASNEGVTASARVLDIIELADSQPDWRPKVDASLFRPGTITQVVGPSGSGKTSALNALRNHLGPANLAWLPQRVGLWAGTVDENVTAWAEDWDENLVEKALEMAALEHLGGSVMAGYDGAEVSGGQAQRVGIARAFYRMMTTDCQWLILDEPFSALDGAALAKISKSLKRLARSGKTIVVVSHQPFEGSDTQVSVEQVMQSA